MKDKFLVLIVTTLIGTILLSGCGDKQETADTLTTDEALEHSSTEEITTEASSTMQSDILIHLEVNPSFDIHVDNGGIIVGVDCLNSDAEKVYKDLEIKNLEYVNGMAKLLAAIYDEGLVHSNSEIVISIKMESSVTYDIFKATDDLINDFNKNVVNISFETNTEIIQNEQGNNDGQRENVENDRPSHIINEDGSETYYTYYDNGTLKSEEKHFIDEDFKTTSFAEFDENGTILKETCNREDGYYHERAFANGILTKEYIHIPHDGGHNITNTYHSNGKLAEKIDYHIHTSQEFIFRYDESGNQTEYIGYDNNDKPVHIVY